MRPRKVLLSACPWLSTSEASDALRDAGGDIEKAKRAVSAARRGNDGTNKTMMMMGTTRNVHPPLLNVLHLDTLYQ